MACCVWKNNWGRWERRMKVEEIGCWSDVLNLMENRGFSKSDAVELALQIFNWGVRAAIDQMRPSRPSPSDLPALPSSAQLPLVETSPAPKPAKPRKEPAKGLHRIPADFVLDDDMRKFAADRAFPPRAIEA